MIPKTIHYVWLGKGEQSETIKKCILSWKEHLPEYDIKLWDEDSFDISSAPQFVKDAYLNKKWAFASDYIRLWVLYNYGGIYLDTDTEVRNNLDRFLSEKLFIGTQIFNISISKKKTKTVTNLSMGVIGSEAYHPYLKECMDAISQTQLVNNDGSFNTTVTNYTMSKILQEKYGFIVDDIYQELNDGIIVYPSSVFADRLAPKDSPDCYTFHWGEMSWFQPKPRGFFHKICWNLNLMRFYHWIEKIRK